MIEVDLSGETRCLLKEQEEAMVRVLCETPLTFEVPGRTIHSPMVSVKVRDIETKLILDTGATDHVFTMELAAEAHLEAIPAEPGTDHAGAPVPSWSLGEVPVEFGGLTLPLYSVIAIDGPPPFTGWGIGGFLSPQRLHRSAWVVIDLVGNRITLIECTDPSLKGWLSDRFPDLQTIVLRREEGEAVRILTSIEPYRDVVAMLNTGSPQTEFAKSALPGLQGIRDDDSGLGLSGNKVTGGQIKNQMLRVADARFEIPTLLLRDEMPPEHPDGQIGMDLLHGTVIAISPDETRPVYWLVQAIP